jgi:PAS domain S-box-containing protein
MQNNSSTNLLVQKIEALQQRLTELENSERKFRATLYGIGDGMIATDASGCVQQMNPVAETLTGWKETDARGRFIDEVFRIINEHTRQSVESPVTRALREGTNHCRTGQPHPSDCKRRHRTADRRQRGSHS